MVIETLTLAHLLQPKTDIPLAPEPIPIVLQIKPEIKKYTVKKNDSLTKIAEKNDTTVKRIWSKNKKLKNQDQLKVGDVLVIPKKDEKLRLRRFKPMIVNIPVSSPKNAYRLASVWQGSNRGGRTYAPGGWFGEVGQCTNFVSSKRSVGRWGNASSWASMAKAEGWYVGAVPRVGAIGQRGNHVVYVERVKGNQVYISERNYDWQGSYREIWRPISYFTYIY